MRVRIALKLVDASNRRRDIDIPRSPMNIIQSRCNYLTHMVVYVWGWLGGRGGGSSPAAYAQSTKPHVKTSTHAQSLSVYTIRTLIQF